MLSKDTKMGKLLQYIYICNKSFLLKVGDFWAQENHTHYIQLSHLGYLTMYRTCAIITRS